MYSWIIGKIASTNKKTITFENNYIGYTMYVPDPTRFEVGKVKKIYVNKILSLNNKNKISEELYGFDNYEQKQMFMKLLNVTGIGPKTAINICANDLSLLKNFVLSSDSESLASLPGINQRIARTLVEELEVNDIASTETNPVASELIRALKSLGYTQKDVEIGLKTIDFSQNRDLPELISMAIKNIAINERTDN